MFQFDGSSGDNQAMQIEPNSTNSNVGIIINAKGTQSVATNSMFSVNSGLMTVNQISDDTFGSNFTFNKVTASPAGGDQITALQFVSTDSVANPTNYAQLDVVILDATDTSEDALMNFGLMSNGAFNQFVVLDGSLGEILLDKRTLVNGQLSALTGNLESYLNDNGSDGALLNLFHETASPAPDDDIGEVRYTSKNDIGGQLAYASIIGIIKDATNTSENGYVEFEVIEDGSSDTYLTLDGLQGYIVADKPFIDNSYIVTTHSFGFIAGNQQDEDFTLLTMDRASTDPTLKWDDSETAFVFDASLIASSGLEVETTFNMPNDTTLPATCSVGDLFQDTDSDDCADTGGGDGALCICKSTNTWALISNF